MGTPSDGEVAQELAAAGARIMAGVGKSTTLLVIVAEQPFDVGIRRSANFRHAEEMIAGGSRLKIVSISEARAMIIQGT
jgi:DNA polymerase-3 subunit epsilon